MWYKRVFALTMILNMMACNAGKSPAEVQNSTDNFFSYKTGEIILLPLPAIPFNGTNRIETGSLQPSTLVEFANSLIGIPYYYGSADPAIGFDCSGFITYVFNHFNIAVPRSSIGFTNIVPEVAQSEAMPGDLVLFTGTDTGNHTVGHMGIISAVNNGEISFIHSSSGRAYGVTVSLLNNFYRPRFIKLIRIFPHM